MSKITRKQVTANEFIKGNIESGVAYEIIRKPFNLKYKIDDILERFKLDEYSRMCRKDYRNGITKDLHYKNTLDKCSEDKPIKMIWVDGYSKLMEFKHDEINENVMNKVKRLLDDNVVGYITDDSCGCYLCCKSEDYERLCKYLKVEYDDEYDNKEYYYNLMFDDLLLSFEEGYDYTGREDRDDSEIYNVTRYVIMNLDRYKDVLLSSKDEKWVNILWDMAVQDITNHNNRINKNNAINM